MMMMMVMMVMMVILAMATVMMYCNAKLKNGQISMIGFTQRSKESHEEVLLWWHDLPILPSPGWDVTLINNYHHHHHHHSRYSRQV